MSVQELIDELRKQDPNREVELDFTSKRAIVGARYAASTGRAVQILTEVRGQKPNRSWLVMNEVNR